MWDPLIFENLPTGEASQLQLRLSRLMLQGVVSPQHYEGPLPTERLQLAHGSWPRGQQLSAVAIMGSLQRILLAYLHTMDVRYLWLPGVNFALWKSLIACL